MSDISATPRLEEASDQVNELFQELPPYLARGLLYLLFAVVLAVLIYSAIAQISEIVSAPAVVVPQGLTRKVHASSAGKVTRVAADEGEQVTQGQVLVYLETDAAQGQLERARAELENRERQVQEELTKKADAIEIAEANQRLTQAQEQLAAAQHALEATMIVTPVDGQLTRLGTHGAGESVQPGQTVAEIAPAGAALVFEAHVANSDMGRVKLGEPAKMKVDAYPHQKYGAVDAHVTYIAPDAVAEAGQPPTYRVILTPSPPTQGSSGNARRGIRLRLGLSATAEIIARRRRLLEMFYQSLRGGE